MVYIEACSKKLEVLCSAAGNAGAVWGQDAGPSTYLISNYQKERAHVSTATLTPVPPLTIALKGLSFRDVCVCACVFACV